MQRWKIHNNLLQDKAGLWKSVDSWIFISEEDEEICIENTTKEKVLGAMSDNKVIQECLVDDKPDHQLWKKGEPDEEGYFTLQNSFALQDSGELKVLTAISDSNLEIKGNITNTTTVSPRIVWFLCS